MASNDSRVLKPGTLYIEARVRDNVDLGLDEAKVFSWFSLVVSFTNSGSG